MPTTVNVLIPVADYGSDPTEVTIPYHIFTEAGFHVTFATENGATPECDSRMLTGWTQKLLGAQRRTVNLYREMEKTGGWRKPLAWTAEGFDLMEYDLLMLPGGHDKGVRQLLDSIPLRQQVAKFFEATKRDGPGKKTVTAICHGVLVLSEAISPSTGKSVIHPCRTTALLHSLEQFAYYSTCAILGDYYKTYGTSHSTVQEQVTAALEGGKEQFVEGKSALVPLVVEDEGWRYVSGRWPLDAEVLAKRAVELVKETVGSEGVEYTTAVGPGEQRDDSS